MARDLRTFVTEVVATEPRSAHVVRITFGGRDLETFVPVSPDQFVYVLLPPPGRHELTVDASFSWEAYQRMPECERPVGAYYTVRYHRPDRAELDLDFVLHDDGGQAASWARDAQPGAPAALWGPRTTFVPPADGVDWYLLVADETGLPGVGAILDSLPRETMVRALIEVPDAGEEVALASGPNTDVTWLHRGAAAAGTTSLLIDAARALELPSGRPYVWGGGESRAMTTVRSYLRHEVGYERERVSLTPFWRHRDNTDIVADD